MEVFETEIPAIKRLIPRRIGDGRGWFSESWNSKRMAEAGLAIDFVQDNHSFSASVGTIRGLHFQAPPMAQTKLIRVTQGAVMDVVADIRRGSPTFSKWVAVELSAENGVQLLVPRGFLHGFVTLTPNTDVLYKVDAYYDPDCDGGVRFDDPDLAIDWGIDPAQAILSDKDAAAPTWQNFDSPFDWEP